MNSEKKCKVWSSPITSEEDTPSRTDLYMKIDKEEFDLVSLQKEAE